jgi:5'(3')-deoxyribonucleotidase
MGYNKIAIVDVDDVCALLGDTWLKRYNEDWDDTLTIEQLTDWDISKFVKPECGQHIFDYLNFPEIYNSVKPREGSIEGVHALRKIGYRVVFATSTPEPVRGKKLRWLEHWGYEPNRRDYVEIEDKSLLLADFLIDDRWENISTFDGMGVLFTRPWNATRAWPFRAKNWDDVVQMAQWQMNLPKDQSGNSN